MDDQYVEARLFMLLSSLGARIVPDSTAPGGSIHFADMDDFADWGKDEELLKATLVGMPNTDAVELIFSIRPRFQTKELQEARRDQLAVFFS